MFVDIRGEKQTRDPFLGNVYSTTVTFSSRDEDEHRDFYTKLRDSHWKSVAALSRGIDEVTQNPVKTEFITCGTSQTDGSFRAGTSRSSKEINRSRYESHYWGFVKAKTQDEADKQFDDMIEQVTMDLQPVDGFRSWAADPGSTPDPAKEAEPVKRHSKGDLLAAAWTGVGLTFAIIVSISHIVWGSW